MMSLRSAQRRLKLIVAQLVDALKLCVGEALRRKLQQAPAALVVLGAFVLAAPGGTAFDMRDYWPSPSAGEQLVVQERTAANAGEVKTVLRRYVNRGSVNAQPVVRMDEYAPVWADAWEFQVIGGMVTEVGTWQGAKHKVYKTGKEIPWGGAQNVGDVVTRLLEVDVAKSSGVTAGYSNYGYQRLEFVDFLPSFTNAGGLTFADVVKINVLQSWCANAACLWPAGQTVYTMDYWLAPGVGIVQVEYLAPTARVDYAVSIATTWETP